MSIRARRKNLRMYNIDASDVQGSPEYLLIAAQQEALAPSSPTIGMIQDAVCLMVFKIPDDSPNVPEVLPITRNNPGTNAEEAKNASKVEKSSKFRIAIHAMILSHDSSDVTQASLDHSSHCLPNILEMSNLTAEEYLHLAKKYPIYVGDYEDRAGVTMANIRRGSAVRVRDNDVQGGVYGSIMERVLSMVCSQTAQSPSILEEAAK